jgi:hypothetical protein
MLDWRFRTWVLALYLAALGWFIVFGQSTKITLHGKLFTAAEGNCSFFLDGEGDSESIQMLTFSEGGYVCDYLKGSNAHSVAITIQPAPR